MSISTIDKP